MSEFVRQGWVGAVLGDLASLITKGTTPSSLGFEYQNSGISFIKVESIDGSGRFLKKKFAYISEAANKALARSVILENDVLFSIAGALGRTAIATKEILPANTNQALAIIRLHDGELIDKEYLYYYLNGPQITETIDRINVQSAQANLSLGDIASFEISYPIDLVEQQKIAKILSTVDNLIEKTQALIDKYTAIKQGMMADLFTRGIDLTAGPNNGKLRPSVEDAPELYKQTELGWVLKEWEVGLLGDHLKRIEQGWSPDCETEPANTGQWGVLKTTAVVWEGYNSLANKALPEGLNPRLEYEVNSGDVLMTRAGPGNRVGVVAYVNSTQNRLILSDKLYRMVPNESLNKEYLSLFLSSAFVQSQLNATKTGLAESQSNISQEIVRKIMAIIPHLDEQNLVVEIIKSMNKKIDAEKKYLRKLSVQKKGLMQDLLTGRVKVQ